MWIWQFINPVQYATVNGSALVNIISLFTTRDHLRITKKICFKTNEFFMDTLSMSHRKKSAFISSVRHTVFWNWVLLSVLVFILLVNPMTAIFGKKMWMKLLLFVAYVCILMIFLANSDSIYKKNLILIWKPVGKSHQGILTFSCSTNQRHWVLSAISHLNILSEISMNFEDN